MRPSCGLRGDAAAGAERPLERGEAGRVERRPATRGVVARAWWSARRPRSWSRSASRRRSRRSTSRAAWSRSAVSVSGASRGPVASRALVIASGSCAPSSVSQPRDERRERARSAGPRWSVMVAVRAPSVSSTAPSGRRVVVTTRPSGSVRVSLADALRQALAAVRRLAPELGRDLDGLGLLAVALGQASASRRPGGCRSPAARGRRGSKPCAPPAASVSVSSIPSAVVRGARRRGPPAS